MVWIVALTKPNQEGIAELNLKRQGFEPYCPRYLQEKPGKPTTIRPLFPRYMFVLIDTFWSSIMGTRGISRVLLGDNGPQTLPTSVIESLKAREINGLVALIAPPKFLPGAKVKITEGSFEGQFVIYEGMKNHDRVSVLMDLLGRKVPIEIEEKSLAAA